MNNGRIRRKDQKLILVEWEDCGDHFLEGINFKTKPDDVQIHVFVNRAYENKNINQVQTTLKDTAIFHESLTNGKDASWTDLLAFLINFYARSSCPYCVSSSFHRCTYHVTLASHDQGKYKELEALLKSNKTHTQVVDGSNTTLLDLFPHVCTECKLILSNRHEAELHDKEDHNYLCKNRACERSRRGNGFYSCNELQRHIRHQQHCRFCDEKIFCDAMKFKKHIKKYHVYCDCSCEEYYNTVEEFLEHYSGVYPLPCLESPDCRARFKNIDEQAFHHKLAHGARYPYYCIACYGNRKLTCVRTSDELIAHVKDIKHKKKEFNLVMIPDKSPLANLHKRQSSGVVSL